MAATVIAVPVAHAQDASGYDGGGDYSGYDSGSSSYDTSGYDYGACSSDCGGYDTSGYDYTTPDNSTPDYSSSSYDSPTYSSPTYASPSYSSPSYSSPIYSAPTSYPAASSNTSVYAPTNTTVTDNGNSCTAGNSCNTTTTITNPAPVIDNNNVIDNPAPVQTVYQQVPVYTPTYSYVPPVCTTCSCNSAYCPQSVVAYNNPTPYISLTAVPYTGLDLGPFGEVVYWSLLVLMCLLGAYLIAVKRVQNDMARWLKTFLFGEKEAPAVIAPATPINVVHTPTTQYARTIPAPASGVDDFIMSQIHRGARA
jgi:hypothetical protein